MSFCSQDHVLTILDTPSFYSTTLHLLSILAIPTHLFGAYCILFKTPSRMISVKWSLLHVHFWTSFMDLMFSLITCPVIILPIMGGYSLGLLALIGMKTKEQTYLMEVTLAATSVSIVGIFENRYHVLSANAFWRKVRFSWYTVNFLQATVFFLPVYNRIPEDQELERIFILEVITITYHLLSVLQSLPCLPEEMKSAADLFVISERPALFLRVMAAEIGFIILQVVIFYQLIKQYFKQFDTKLSERTLMMQKKLIRTLILQLVLPLVIIVVPLFYCGISSWLRYHNQGLTNLSMIVIASHGFFSTGAMILIHLPYRMEILRIFGRSRIDTMDSSTRNSMAVQATII